MGTMLSFENVELYYDHVYALKGVTIDVDEGETVALIGANGAGKSSILRAITGLRKIRSGTITYQGQRLDGRNPAEIVRMGIAMVPEGRRVFPFMSVKDNLMMGAFTRTDKAGIAATLESVLDPLPAPQGALQPGLRHALRRRAADDGDRPRADGEAEAPPPRRALPRHRPEAGAGHRPLHRRHQPRREGLRPPRGAELPHGALDLQPRLCPLHRRGRRRRPLDASS